MGTLKWDTVIEAVKEAKNTQAATSRYANELADLMLFSLRGANPYRLKALKRALRDFDSTKMKWN